ncbi:MAG: hypothetical protein D6723_04675 [Acidobacteria bacterium]|nr:MAG: hypothetical protein D6723_04675 [Acidobacteriota bacterium]
MANNKLNWLNATSAVRKGDYVVFRDTYLGICRDDDVDHDMRLCEVYSEVHTTEYVPADFFEKLEVTSERFRSMLKALREQLRSWWGEYPDWSEDLFQIH